MIGFLEWNYGARMVIPIRVISLTELLFQGAIVPLIGIVLHSEGINSVDEAEVVFTGKIHSSL